MITLRQIEVIRAVMVTGTIVGAARLLNVSAPGISRQGRRFTYWSNWRRNGISRPHNEM